MPFLELLKYLDVFPQRVLVWKVFYNFDLSTFPL